MRRKKSVKANIVKVLCTVSALVLIICLCACGKAGDDFSKMRLEYGESQKYTHKDIDAAADVVKKQLNDFECVVELHYLSYVGDDESAEHLNYCLDYNADFVDCLVFDSEFKVLEEGDGSLAEGDVHTYTWYLAREEGGSWQLLTYGYA